MYMASCVEIGILSTEDKRIAHVFLFGVVSCSPYVHLLEPHAALFVFALSGRERGCVRESEGERESIGNAVDNACAISASRVYVDMLLVTCHLGPTL